MDFDKTADNTLTCRLHIQARQIFKLGNDTTHKSNSNVKKDVSKKGMAKRTEGKMLWFSNKCCKLGLRVYNNWIIK